MLIFESYNIVAQAIGEEVANTSYLLLRRFSDLLDLGFEGIHRRLTRDYERTAALASKTDINHEFPNVDFYDICHSVIFERDLHATRLYKLQSPKTFVGKDFF